MSPESSAPPTIAHNVAQNISKMPASKEPLPYFLRSFEPAATPTKLKVLAGAFPSWLAGSRHYRLLPGRFPSGMAYHFDGLATVLRFSFTADGGVAYSGKAYTDGASTDYSKCLFFGTGTGPTLGTEVCFTNPGVNLLPIKDQLWLTIDTSRWGRVDPVSLETIVDAKVDVPSLVLNAHPACDRSSQQCYVQHPCPKSSSPLSDQACISLLTVPEGDDEHGLGTTILSRITLPKKKIIQHSHSPCVTPHYVVSKLDAFTPRSPLNLHGGLLKYVHQGEDSAWMIMDRRTNASRFMR